MTNQTKYGQHYPDSAYAFQETPTKLESDDLCFVEDPSALIARMALKNLELNNIDEAPHIVLHVEPSKRKGYNLQSEAVMEDKIDADLTEAYWTPLLRHVPAYAIDQMIRYAESSSLALAIFKCYSTKLIEMATTLKETPLKSLPHAGMTKEEMEALPLPFIITADKHYVLSLLDEDDELVSKEEFQDKLVEDEYKGIPQELTAAEKKKKEDRETQLDKTLEKVEKEYGITIEYEEKNREESVRDRVYDRDYDLLTRGLPPKLAYEMVQRMQAVGAPSEIAAILEYQDGIPTYELLEVEPNGVICWGRVKPYKGELVSIVAKAMTNFKEVFFDPRKKLDINYLHVDGLSNFNFELIEEFAPVLDRKHCVQFGWDG